MGFISVRWGQVKFWAVPMCLGPYKALIGIDRLALID